MFDYFFYFFLSVYPSAWDIWAPIGRTFHEICLKIWRENSSFIKIWQE